VRGGCPARRKSGVHASEGPFFSRALMPQSVLTVHRPDSHRTPSIHTIQRPLTPYNVHSHRTTSIQPYSVHSHHTTSIHTVQRSFTPYSVHSHHTTSTHTVQRPFTHPIVRPHPVRNLLTYSLLTYYLLTYLSGGVLTTYLLTYLLTCSLLT